MLEKTPYLKKNNLLINLLLIVMLKSEPGKKKKKTPFFNELFQFDIDNEVLVFERARTCVSLRCQVGSVHV